MTATMFIVVNGVWKVMSMSRNISYLSGRKSGSLLNKLVEQSQSDEHLADEYNLGASTIPGTRSFYDFLNTSPSQTQAQSQIQAYVCNGTACLCKGGQDDVRKKLEQHFDIVGEMSCLGRCYEISAFHIRTKSANYSGDSINALDDILNSTKTNSNSPNDSHNQYLAQSFSNTSYLVNSENLNSIDDFKTAVNQLLSSSADQTLEHLLSSGLRGRGGAGFPTAIKWRSCKEQNEEQNKQQKYVICNADEGDPGAFSDRYLLEQQPLKVIFGMLMCAYLIAANSGFIYIRGEYPESVDIMRSLLKQLHEENLLGSNILGADFNFQIELVVGQGAYICGEETALIASIEGRRAEVDVRPPFPTVEGLYKKPTVVNNVETLAAAASIFIDNTDSYQQIGNGKSTGTKLICLDGLFNNPGLFEVDMSTPLSSIIDNIGGGFIRPIKAIQIGGPLGGIVPVELLKTLTLDYESFSAAGFLLGHASFVCIPEDFSALKFAHHLFKFVADESCGKCFPCRIGSVRGKEMLVDKNYDAELLIDLLDTLEQGSLCALGGGLPLPIKNLLEYFPEEFARSVDHAG